MYELTDQLKSEHPEHLKNAHILKAKLSLNEICYTKAKEHLMETNIEIGTVFDKLQDSHSQIFKEFFKLIQALVAPESADLREKLEQNEKETAEVIAAANNLNKEYEIELKE